MAFHEFSRSLGRLSRSASLQPMFPVRPVPLTKTEPLKVIFDSVNTKPVSADVQNIAKQNFSTLPPNIKKAQELFQKDMNKEIYLAAGARDKVLFGITVAGLIYCSAVIGSHMWDFLWIK